MFTNNEVPLKEDGSIDFDRQLVDTVKDNNFNPYQEAIDLLENAESETTQVAILKTLIQIAEDRSKTNLSTLPIQIKQILLDEIPKPPESYENEG